MNRCNALLGIQIILLIVVFVTFTYGYMTACDMSCIFLGLICIYIIGTVNKTRKQNQLIK